MSAFVPPRISMNDIVDERPRWRDDDDDDSESEATFTTATDPEGDSAKTSSALLAAIGFVTGAAASAMDAAYHPGDAGVKSSLGSGREGLLLWAGVAVAAAAVVGSDWRRGDSDSANHIFLNRVFPVCTGFASGYMAGSVLREKLQLDRSRMRQQLRSYEQLHAMHYPITLLSHLSLVTQ